MLSHDEETLRIAVAGHYRNPGMTAHLIHAKTIAATALVFRNGFGGEGNSYWFMDWDVATLAMKLAACRIRVKIDRKPLEDKL